MNKFKVGQRVKIKATGNIGEILDIDEDADINCYGSTNSNYYVSFKNNDSLYFYFFTVHDLEEVKDILDSGEKEYLSNVIKPFKHKVKGIRKGEFYNNEDEQEKEYITIYIKNDFSIYLPNFKKNTMYKNMEINKAYKLEELRL